MPFISEAASAIKTRFGFQDQSESVRSTSDISKSTSRENLSQSSTVSSFNDVDEGRAGNSEIAVRSFDLPEDPAFWKDRSVQVIIRTRPLNSSEISLQGYNRCVRQESYQTIAWTGHPESRFTFDLVADENVTQEKLFKVVGLPMVENCMSGYNNCMFAYGQTGSGKTHTMLGDIEGGTRRHSVNCGMTPRVFEYLFSRIQKEKEARRDEKLQFTCKCSFLEIYNEQILDLLNPSSVNLQIREDLKKGVYVEGLTESEVTCAREVLQQLIQGSANRKVAATNMNRASSRSHSVFTCVIESTWDSQSVTHHRFARLNLVDLAGSERQKSSGAEGERFKEATNINKSLSTLGLVIMNLVSISNGKSLHVPYRDSKLTFLLQDSLGGNSKTTIIANISPSNCSSLETLSTLKFAQRAKFIKNNAIVNEDASGDVLVMRMQIQQLKKEVSRLRGIVNGGAENQDDDTLSLGFPGSPGSFKWEGLCGTFSPFNSDRKASQKEYEVALVGAFRREKDKDLALQALATENQAAMQLAKQREDEIRGLKMRLRFREAGIKRLEAMASGKISAETHFLKEKEEHLKEIEVLRAQVDRNQEVTRFAMENLRLKEEIRRLKSFCEEGERERMNEQIMVLQNKLLEALDWKFMHESDPSAIQKGSPGLLTEGHHNSEQSKEEQASPWKASINEENELFHLQAIQNQAEMDFLRKKLDLCMEEKQKLERHIKELETEVEIMRSSKLMEKTQKVESDIPERANDMYSISFNDQMELKAMVDAIAAASEREAEAHEVAISLSKKNDELQSKVKVLLQENNKLIDLYQRAIADLNNSSDRIAHGGGNEIQNTTSFDANSDDKDMESKKLEDLEHQLMEMHDENEKLMGLYEKAMQERDEFKRMLSSRSVYDVKDKGEFNYPEKLVEVDGGEYFESDKLAVNKGKCMQSDEPSFNGGPQISEENDVFRWNMQNDSDQFLETAIPTEEVHMDLNSDQSPDNFTGESFYEPSTTNLGPPFSRETGLLAEDTVFSQFSEMDGSGKCLLHSHDNPDKLENVRITSELEAKKELALVVKMKLDKAQEKLSNSAQNVNEFGFLEKAILDVGELSRVIEGMQDLIHLREQQLESHKLFSSEMQEKSALTGRKLLALKYALSNFSSPIAYFEQREVRARARVDASKSYANQKREDLARLQAQKDEIEAARNKIQEGEIELRNNLAYLKSKLEEENQRQENQKVLFSLDNVERAEIHLVHKSGKHGCKAIELLKSEEEKTKLLNEIKLSRDKLGIMKKEIEDLNKNSQKAENKIRGVSLEVHKASKDVEEMELALNNIAHEKEILLEIGEDGKTQIDNTIIEYQECMFAAYLKEEESKILEEEMQTVLAELERLQTEKAAIINRTSQLLHGRECHAFSLSDNMQEVLEDVGRSILEAKLLLEQGS